MERKNFAVLCAAVLCFWLFALALGTAEGVGLRAVMHPEERAVSADAGEAAEGMALPAAAAAPQLSLNCRAAILIPLTYPPATSPHTYPYTSCALIHIRIRTRIRAPIRTHAHAHPHTLPPANIHRVIHIICTPSKVMHLSTVFAYPVARKPHFCILFGHGYHSRSDDGHHNSSLAGNRAACGAADTVYQGSAGTAQP